MSKVFHGVPIINTLVACNFCIGLIMPDSGAAHRYQCLRLKSAMRNRGCSDVILVDNPGSITQAPVPVDAAAWEG